MNRRVGVLLAILGILFVYMVAVIHIEGKFQELAVYRCYVWDKDGFSGWGNGFVVKEDGKYYFWSAKHVLKMKSLYYCLANHKREILLQCKDLKYDFYEKQDLARFEFDPGMPIENCKLARYVPGKAAYLYSVDGNKSSEFIMKQGAFIGYGLDSYGVPASLVGIPGYSGSPVIQNGKVVGAFVYFMLPSQFMYFEPIPITYKFLFWEW